MNSACVQTKRLIFFARSATLAESAAGVAAAASLCLETLNAFNWLEAAYRVEERVASFRVKCCERAPRRTLPIWILIGQHVEAGALLQPPLIPRKIKPPALWTRKLLANLCTWRRRPRWLRPKPLSSLGPSVIGFLCLLYPTRRITPASVFDNFPRRRCWQGKNDFGPFSIQHHELHAPLAMIQTRKKRFSIHAWEILLRPFLKRRVCWNAISVNGNLQKDCSLRNLLETRTKK